MLPELRPIPSAPDYFAGDDGEIYSAKSGSLRVLKSIAVGGPGQKRLKVEPCINGVNITRRVHRLIAEAFHGPCPPGLMCRHLNGNSLNNRPSNLRWGTHAENMEDEVLNGKRKLNASIVGEIRAEAARGVAHTVLASIHGVSQGHISHVVSGRRWASA